MKINGKTLINGLITIGLVAGTFFVLRCNNCHCCDAADERCVGKDSLSTIDGKPLTLADWNTDCSCNAKSQLEAGGDVVLSTYGIIITYDNDYKILHSYIIRPKVTFKMPMNSSLFAGYSSEDGAKSAFCRANPDEKMPALWK